MPEDQAQPAANDGEIATLRAQLEESNRAVADLRAKIDADKSAIDGRLKSDLESVSKERDTARAELKRIHDQLTAEASAIYDAMSDDVKKHVDLVKDSLSPEKWLAYLRAESSRAVVSGDNDTPPPKLPQGNDRSPQPKSGKYKPRFPEFIADTFSRGTHWLEKLTMRQSSGANIFSIDKPSFVEEVDKMRAVPRLPGNNRRR